MSVRHPDRLTPTRRLPPIPLRRQGTGSRESAVGQSCEFPDSLLVVPIPDRERTCSIGRVKICRYRGTPIAAGTQHPQNRGATRYGAVPVFERTNAEGDLTPSVGGRDRIGASRGQRLQLQRWRRDTAGCRLGVSPAQLGRDIDEFFAVDERMADRYLLGQSFTPSFGATRASVDLGWKVWGTGMIISWVEKAQLEEGQRVHVVHLGGNVIDTCKECRIYSCAKCLR